MIRLFMICFSLLNIQYLNAQKVKIYSSKMKQEFGVNTAGLFVKNQATIAPSFIYRYKFNDYQLRIQGAFDNRITNESRDGFFKQQQTSSFFQRDTNTKYEPAKNNTIGLMVGFQKNELLKKSAFNYYYGIDLIYFLKDYKRKGRSESSVVQSTITQTTVINTELKNKLKTIGVGVPLGISYFWNNKFFATIEAKFVIAYQINTIKAANESTFTSSSSTSITVITTGGITTSYGFDIGIKPLSGLCLGIQF